MYNETVLEKLKINTGKHEQADSVVAYNYKEGDRQDIR